MPFSANAARGAPTSLHRRAVLQGALATLASRPARAGPRAPASAQAFIDSIGVCTHLGSEPYASGFARFRALVGASGIRHLRDELRPGNDLDRWRDLHAAFGIRSHLLVSPATNTVPEMLAYLVALGVERVSAVEGQNEGDSDWFKASPSAGSNWSETVVAYQRAVFQALRPRYAAARLPILSPSVIDWKPEDVPLLRAAAPFCDIVALHPYVQHGQAPETADSYAGLDWYLHAMRDTFKPGAPVMTTEAGYNNLVQPGGSAVSEAAAAIYLPRLLLHHFGAGVLRTFLYEFMDESGDPHDSESHWGLVRHDGTPKAAYKTIAALIAALGASGPARRGPGLTAALREAGPEVRCETFLKRDGSLVLAMWRALPVWNVAAAADVAVPAQALEVTTDGGVAGAAFMVLDAAPVWIDAKVENGSVTMPVGARVVLLQLKS